MITFFEHVFMSTFLSTQCFKIMLPTDTLLTQSRTHSVWSFDITWTLAYPVLPLPLFYGSEEKKKSNRDSNVKLEGWGFTPSGTISFRSYPKTR